MRGDGATASPPPHLRSLTKRAFRLANHAQVEKQRPDGSFVAVHFSFDGYDTVEVPRPSAAKVPPPALAALLDGLPTT